MVKSNYVIPGLPKKFCEDRLKNVTAALSAETQAKIERARDQYLRGRTPFNPKTQPRSNNGQFRQILARLRYDLGDTELQNIVSQIKKTEKLADAGDIQKSTDAAHEVVKMVDDIKAGTLNSHDIKNVREGARALGKVLAYLPLPQGDPNEKVRFSDIPKSTRDLISGMIDRVTTKLGNDKAAEVTATLRNYMAGGLTMDSDSISAELNRLLRILT